MPPRCTRRRALQLSGTATGFVLTGCTNERSNPATDRTASPTSEQTQSTPSRPTPTDGPSGDRWPLFGYDQRNTGYNPNAAGPRDGVEVAWHFDGGTSLIDCSPVLKNGIVYICPTGDFGDIFALDATTGTQLWKVDTLGGVRSAPAIVEDTLYAGTMWSEFYAVDTDGAVRWNRRFDRGQFSDSAPVVVDGTIYVGMDRSPALLALDAETGETRWRVSDFTPETEEVSASPALADGIVVSATDNHSVFALDAESGTVQWQRNIGTDADSSPAIHDGVVYYSGANLSGDTMSRVWAVDLQTGETYWRYDVDGEQLGTSPAIAHGRVYVPVSKRHPQFPDGTETMTPMDEDRGRVYALDATTGEHEWTTRIPIFTQSSPAVDDGLIYLGAGEGVSALRTDGRNAWRVDLTPVSPRDEVSLRSSPAIGDGRLYVGCSDGRLYALEGNTG